jgi:hypothetical protein
MSATSIDSKDIKQVKQLVKELAQIPNAMPRIDCATLIRPSGDQFARNINVYDKIPFAGGDGDYSILSVLFGAHSIGGGIFGYLNMIDSNKVRVQCVECRQAVMDFQWMDDVSRIKGSVKAWRAAFPVARAVNVSYRYDLVDADFVHIRGDARARLHTVNMDGCRAVTDAAFIHLRGINTLYMYSCNQDTITDAAFVHLRGMQKLNMSRCNQGMITDAAFVHLRGIHTLLIRGCSQRSITDVAFESLRGIHTLDMNSCDQPTITDAAFVHLRGIHTLNIGWCNQITITDAAFTHLRGVQTLQMGFCDQATITKVAIANLVGIVILDTASLCREVRLAAATILGVEYESDADFEAGDGEGGSE